MPNNKQGLDPAILDALRAKKDAKKNAITTAKEELAAQKNNKSNNIKELAERVAALEAIVDKLLNNL